MNCLGTYKIRHFSNFARLILKEKVVLWTAKGPPTCKIKPLEVDWQKRTAAPPLVKSTAVFTKYVSVARTLDSITRCTHQKCQKEEKRNIGNEQSTKTNRVQPVYGTTDDFAGRHALKATTNLRRYTIRKDCAPQPYELRTD